MADNRPWAKIDTGYIMNPKWFQVERVIAEYMTVANGMANSKSHDSCHAVAIAGAVRCAREAHLASILYCAQNRTDGVFPVRAIKAVVGAITDQEESAITALFEVGLWINHPGGMAEDRDYLEHQTPASLSKKRSEAGKKGADIRWNQGGKANGNGNEVANGKSLARANAEKKREEENRREVITPLPPRGGTEETVSDFQTFWSAFPSERKRAKADCQKLFTQAVKAGTPSETIIEAAHAYRDDPNREPQFTVNPKTWLREQRWESGPLPAKQTTVSRPELWLQDLDYGVTDLRAIKGGF